MAIKYVVCDKAKEQLQCFEVFDTESEASNFIDTISFCASEEATEECFFMYYIQQVETA
jgi:hypothetical protein|tara:strand:+ start:1029 stop:1205 length:177 start_codon:yes stop_codon:yes gene_type:complete